MARLRFLLLLLLHVPALAWAALAVEVRVEGIDGALYDNVLQYLTLAAEREHPLLEMHRLRRLHQRAEGEIREALRPFGYYQPEVSATLSEHEGGWLAHYRIVPGTPVRVRELALQLDGEAAADPAFHAWRKAFPLQVGDVLQHVPYERAKRDLLQLARDRGYFSARLQQQALEVTLADNSARVVLHLVSGPRHVFGAVQFDEVALSDELLRRFLTFQPGQPFDAERLFELQRALADSDYFEFIEVQAGPETAVAGAVPVAVHLRLRPPARYTFGLGYGTDTGPRLSLGMERRRVNRAGHRLNIETTVSQVQAGVRGVYRIPLQRNPDSDFLSFSGGWEEEDLDTSQRETLTVGTGLTMQLGRWQRTYALTVQNERYTVADQQDTTLLVLPSVNLLRVEADDRLFPREGWRLGAELRGASETLGSDASLLQGVLRAKAVLPLAGGRFITRADLGLSQTPDFARIPASLRFFAGGDNSIRGYAYKSLGPVNAAGEVVGGRHLLVLSGEYEYYFGRIFGAALFYDAGNAFDDDDYALKRGAGAGLRWRLPFGVLRLDAATPVNEGGVDWRLHLTVGPDL
jgi:Outer membrane protein